MPSNSTDNRLLSEAASDFISRRSSSTPDQEQPAPRLVNSFNRAHDPYSVGITNFMLKMPTPNNCPNISETCCINNNEWKNDPSISVSGPVNRYHHDICSCLGYAIPADWPPRLDCLLEAAQLPCFDMLAHSWNPADCSENISLRPEDPFTFYRQPAAQCSDGIRGKMGYSRGIHLWRILWNPIERGTHAVIGE
ncbi:unnamed protein product [Protopolystoma xenopodis]|uniref:Uncharacterized protein n=1 Tax=Protopolystoma xenopodis TaxID=117903 RepID=A0A3S5B9E6_9PLAT|nr:unnamed protein product [Protopolystoma xenopodis]